MEPRSCDATGKVNEIRPKWNKSLSIIGTLRAIILPRRACKGVSTYAMP